MTPDEKRHVAGNEYALKKSKAMRHRYIVHSSDLDVKTRREMRLEDLLRCCLVEFYRTQTAEALREEIEAELRKEGSGY